MACSHCIFVDTWSTPHMAQAIARMAESGRAKVKEVNYHKVVIYRLILLSYYASLANTTIHLYM